MQALTGTEIITLKDKLVDSPYKQLHFLQT